MAGEEKKRSPEKAEDEEPPLMRPLYALDSLPEHDRIVLRELLAPDETVLLVQKSDMLYRGTYGTSAVVLTARRLMVLEATDLVNEVPMNCVVSALCRELVGNGILEVRTKHGERIDIARYSKTVADGFQEAAEMINRQARATEEVLTVHDDEAKQVAVSQNEKRTYRCPRCGHPLHSPTDACPKCAGKKDFIMRLFRLLFEQKKVFIVGTILGVVVVGIQLVPPFLVRLLIDKVMAVEGLSASVRYNRLYLLVGAFIILMGVRFVVQYYRIKYMGILTARVVLSLRRKLFRALQRLSISYYDREHTGRIMARVLSDTQTINQFVVNGVQRIVLHGLMVAAIPVIMLIANPKLAIVALAPVPVVVALARMFSKRFNSIYRMVRRRYATLSATVSETVSGMRVVKSFAQEERETELFRERSQEHYDAQMQAVGERARFKPSVLLMMAVGTIAVWLIGGRNVIGGTVQLGMLVLFLSYMNQLYNPIQVLLDLAETFQQSATAAERVFSIIDMPTDVRDHTDAVAPETCEGRIKLEDVWFNYEDSSRVLKGINLEIKSGRMIGLVGETGCGKSTLISLICRFYDPTRGKITLDGRDLRDIKLQWLRNNIGLVLQETFLFAGTIRDNISYGKPDAAPLEIMRAAKAANAHGFIMNLPDGYDTEVGERGIGLSGGEKQRIAIARAILKDPVILIFDEATSSVDTATEVSIQEAMDRLVKGRTTIAIAHRLSTLRHADRLLVLEKGEIVEDGTHEELLAKDGIYAKLCNIQADFAQYVNTTDLPEKKRAVS
ncbi:MAG: ABC transporter transmembrane domain-containing protein [Kiritimatiellia bacterium]